MIPTVSTSNTPSDQHDGQPFPPSPSPVGLYRLPALSAELVFDAQRAIGAWLSSGFPDPELDHLTHAERMRRYTYGSYGDHALRESAPIQRIVSHYEPAVREMVGTDTWRGNDVQIALRMPGEGGIRHIDGIADGNPADPRIPNAVLGVYLSDVGARDGAFAVWPQLRDDLCRYGVRLQHEPHADDDRLEYKAVVEARGRDARPRVVTGGAGTAFLVHGGVPHCNLPNLGTGIRYAVFARYYRHETYPHGLAPDNAGRAWEHPRKP